MDGGFVDLQMTDLLYWLFLHFDIFLGAPLYAIIIIIIIIDITTIICSVI